MHGGSPIEAAGADRTRPLTRRQALAVAAAGGAAVVIAACGGEMTGTVPPRPRPDPAAGSPTPACGDDGATPEQTEGPFFTPDSPGGSRSSSRDGRTALLLTGRMLDTDCRPIPGALLDFWQADDEGEYDNSRLPAARTPVRGCVRRVPARTSSPDYHGPHPPHPRQGATRGGSVLTTQLYFPDEPGNESDAIFDPLLLVDLRKGRRAASPLRLRARRGRAPLPSTSRAVSSVGRASALHRGGHWFEPSTAHPAGHRLRTPPGL